MSVRRHRKPRTPAERLRIFQRDSYTCRYCKETFEPAYLEVDHEHPVSWGGEDSDDNCVTACRDCNRAKAARPVRPITPDEELDLFFEAMLHPDDRGAQRRLALLDRGEVLKSGDSAHNCAWELVSQLDVKDRAEQLKKKRDERAIRELMRRLDLL